MSFNDTKFELLRYGKNEILKDFTEYLGPSGAQIEEHQHVKDLGVLMSNDATFSELIRQVPMKAHKYAGWILTTFSTRENPTCHTLENFTYTTYGLLFSVMMSNKIFRHLAIRRRSFDVTTHLRSQASDT